MGIGTSTILGSLGHCLMTACACNDIDDMLCYAMLCGVTTNWLAVIGSPSSATFTLNRKIPRHHPLSTIQPSTEVDTASILYSTPRQLTPSRVWSTRSSPERSLVRLHLD